MAELTQHVHDEKKLDLTQAQRHVVQEILQKILPEREVWAFGSRVRLTAKPYSDLDLVVIGSKPLDLMLLASLKGDFSDSDLPFEVDVVDWATLSDNFCSIISTHKIVIHSPV